MSDHNGSRQPGRLCGGWPGMVVVGGMVGLSLAAGCSQEKKDPAATQPAPVGDLSAVANNVTVTISADGMRVPQIISSGWTNFIVQNTDTVPHTFGIEGNGVKRVLPNQVQPGTMEQLRVRLEPGKYRAYCPDVGPNVAGTSLQITVAEW